MCEFFNSGLFQIFIVLVVFYMALGLNGFINHISSKRELRKCNHTQCEKTGESVTFDTELNRTETVTLKCLNCEKVIQVKK
ncbi:hypothetical protein [Acinetobacter phage vB_AbaM_IME284]|nr:hypothetical protein [Acinetobacter phage vB_AbaM_IME284]